MSETFTGTVLSMAHVALNSGRAGVAIMLGIGREERLLLRVSQIVLALDIGQRSTADGQLAQLEADIARDPPAPVEYAALCAVRGMLDAAVGPQVAELRYLRLRWTSRVLSSIALGDFTEARHSLGMAFQMEDE